MIQKKPYYIHYSFHSWHKTEDKVKVICDATINKKALRVQVLPLHYPFGLKLTLREMKTAKLWFKSTEFLQMAFISE